MSARKFTGRFNNWWNCRVILADDRFLFPVITVFVDSVRKARCEHRLIHTGDNVDFPLWQVVAGRGAPGIQLAFIDSFRIWPAGHPPLGTPSSMRSLFLIPLFMFLLVHACPLQAQVWTEPLPIMDLAGAGDFMAAATQGGVVTWKRSSPWSQLVTTAHGLPAQVVLSVAIHPLNNELMLTTTNGVARGSYTGPWTTLGALPDESGAPYYSSLALPKGGWVLGSERGKILAWHGTAVDSMHVPTGTGRVIALAFRPQWIAAAERVAPPDAWHHKRSFEGPQSAVDAQSISLFQSGLVAVLDNDGVWLLLDAAKSKWQRLDAGDNLPFDLILDATIDAQGALWIASRHGTARIKLPGVIEWFPSDAILSERANVLFSAPNGLLYLGLADRLAQLDPAGDPPIASIVQWTDRPVTSIASDDEGLWWTDGTVVCSPSGGERQVPLSLADGHALSIVAQADTMWIGHPMGRLSRFAAGEWTRFGTADGLPLSDISSLVMFGGLLHVGTAEGVYVEKQLNGETQFDATSGPPGVVRTLVVHEGALLAGSSEGLWERDAFGWRSLSLWYGANEVRSLVAVPGILWVSAGWGGVAFRNQHGWHPVAADPALSDSFFGSLQRHDDGRIAVATNRGVALWDGGTLHGVAAGPSEFVHDVQWWGDALVIGTNSGLWMRGADGAWVWHGIFDGLAGVKVRAFAQGPEESLWVASTQGVASLPWLDPTSRRQRPPLRQRRHLPSTSTIFRQSEGNVQFKVPHVANASRVEIFDIRGRLVRSLVGHAGQVAVPWDGRDGSGRTVGQGVYFMRMQSPQETYTRRFLWLR